MPQKHFLINFRHVLLRFKNRNMSCLTLDMHHWEELSSFRLFSDYLGFLIWAQLRLFRPILAFGSFRLILTVLSSFRLIRAHLGSFEFISLMRLLWLLRPFNLDYLQPIKYILEEITLIYILLIRCKLYAAAVISLQFTKKNFKCVNICFMIDF